MKMKFFKTKINCLSKLNLGGGGLLLERANALHTPHMKKSTDQHENIAKWKFSKENALLEEEEKR